jgi:hypothetical protein
MAEGKTTGAMKEDTSSSSDAIIMGRTESSTADELCSLGVIALLVDV